MREYELVYIVQPDATPEKEKEIQTLIGEKISGAGGITLLWDDWGKRKLAYEIQKFQKGHYMLVNFLGAGAAIPEIERSLRLDGDVLRFLTVKVSERVRDVDTRIEEARKEEAERARRREERERAEAEREERERERRERLAAEAAAAGVEPAPDDDDDEDDDDDGRSEVDDDEDEE